MLFLNAVKYSFNILFSWFKYLLDHLDFFFDTAYLTKGLYLYSDGKNDMVKDIIGENYA